MKLKSILYISLLVILELLSVSSLKYWSETKNNLFLYIGLLGYLLVGITFSYILHVHSNMTVINSMWQVLNIIAVSMMGLLLYKEKLNLIQYIGVLFAIISVILLTIE